MLILLVFKKYKKNKKKSKFTKKKRKKKVEGPILRTKQHFTYKYKSKKFQRGGGGEKLIVKKKY
jgi:hypothetical protein